MHMLLCANLQQADFLHRQAHCELVMDSIPEQLCIPKVLDKMGPPLLSVKYPTMHMLIAVCNIYR